ncbi:type IX secretion system protein PorD [Rhodohalobacter sp. 8-1]|uniref:type IX secretion system protein PorD n=1 Tax=Rhodohalobacter sp. 8-1 TaxID=3131972 RepID=UPI0030EDD313
MWNKIQKLKSILVFGLIVLALLPEWSSAQEFNCEVTVNSRQISGSAYEYVSDLEDELENYINRNRWTDDTFEEFERIKCQIQIALTSVDDQFNYTAEAVFSVRRPIYNTIQESAALVLSDNNWAFGYPRNKNLVFDELQFDDLTSLIDFYIYVILGYDYDSFEELGGSRFYSQAQDIFELGRNSGASGWGRSIGAQRNRNGLISDLTNPNYQPLREAYYRYHRYGLDQFTLDSQSAISEVIDALSTMEEAKRRTSNNYLFDIFFDTKYTEIVAMLQAADIQTRLEAYNILRDVDPSHSSSYERLQN